jgi:hypothetical protein
MTKDCNILRFFCGEILDEGKYVRNFNPHMNSCLGFVLRIFAKMLPGVAIGGI